MPTQEISSTLETPLFRTALAKEKAFWVVAVSSSFIANMANLALLPPENLAQFVAKAQELHIHAAEIYVLADQINVPSFIIPFILLVLGGITQYQSFNKMMETFGKSNPGVKIKPATYDVK